MITDRNCARIIIIIIIFIIVIVIIIVVIFSCDNISEMNNTFGAEKPISQSSENQHSSAVKTSNAKANLGKIVSDAFWNSSEQREKYVKNVNPGGINALKCWTFKAFIVQAALLSTIKIT